jgi:uncharacterized protein
VKIEPATSSSEWWEGLKQRRIGLVVCANCSERWVPLTSTCPHCGSWTSVPLEASGRGVVYSWVGVVRSVSRPGDVPYAVAEVELEEGPRLLGRFDDEGGPVSAGLAVVARFVEVDGRTVVSFVADAAPER